ncbi:hypothetical protein PDESU_01019 [Pontiella desulfatans]|uniref:Lipoprotein n=1 Tax=Pontiella desulfatans TaxID=2750659 RepID=A0A6C2TZ48_PONDE|nr:hypothetical protein [Pontiella desulfatans]VGO12466.1 hypothetical protein PDESU_01019 [Pontiella desulfatans]
MFKRIMMTTVLLAALTGCKTVSPEQAITKQCDENRAAIEKTIQDPERRSTMLAVMDSFETEIHAIASDSEQARKRYDTALRNYETTDAQLKELQQDVAASLGRLCSAAKTHSLELRKHCSAEEWEQLTAHYHELKNIAFL